MVSAVSSFCGSRVAAFKANAGLQRRTPVTRGVAGAQMRKEGIHPQWFPEAKVFCNGVEVMTVGGTKKEYNVDVYSGNHPFYQGAGAVIVTDDGQLNKFKKRFAGLEELTEINQAMAAVAGPSADEIKASKKGKGGAGAAKAGGKKK